VNEHDRITVARELYDHLRGIARARMAGQAADHTLDPTGLANEAVLRLLKTDMGSIRNEGHFLAMAAEAMRQILVDHARGKHAAKRGGGAVRCEITDETDFGSVDAEPEQVLVAHEALATLEGRDPEAASIVKLRLFGGLPPEEIAALMGVSRRTLERRLRFALASMRVLLQRSVGEEA
jgi:RNA polymerase sigma factor (TIGR02999 family)